MEPSFALSESNVLDGGLFLALVLVSIILLPISMSFLSGKLIGSGTRDEVLSDPSNSLNETDMNSTKYRSSIVAPSILDSRTTTYAADDKAAILNDKKSNDNSWRCACSGGFLPPGMFGNMESVLKMGTGQCYHK